MTLRKHIATNLTHNVLAVAILIAIGVAGVATQETTYAARPEVTNSPAALIAANDCWTDEAPAGVVPGHVVVTVDGVSLLGGERMVGKALAQVFDGADYGLTVNGFCR